MEAAWMFGFGLLCFLFGAAAMLLLGIALNIKDRNQGTQPKPTFPLQEDIL
jgi:hypothetical protein